MSNFFSKNLTFTLVWLVTKILELFFFLLQSCQLFIFLMLDMFIIKLMILLKITTIVIK